MISSVSLCVRLVEENVLNFFFSSVPFHKMERNVLKINLISLSYMKKPWIVIFEFFKNEKTTRNEDKVADKEKVYLTSRDNETIVFREQRFAM